MIQCSLWLDSVLTEEAEQLTSSLTGCVILRQIDMLLILKLSLLFLSTGHKGLLLLKLSFILAYP
jgi:hypothetical protein